MSLHRSAGLLAACLALLPCPAVLAAPPDAAMPNPPGQAAPPPAATAPGFGAGPIVNGKHLQPHGTVDAADAPAAERRLDPTDPSAPTRNNVVPRDLYGQPMDGGITETPPPH